ncbi:unnamed protein product [Oikopleura dioica]|uniref:Uncharacterized protein n=1 Tax=Oikopleura dioica TaxID=34765 RepID=E4XRF2_OIKDI|nr:unnamed protein product [Oikopleura dioica]
MFEPLLKGLLVLPFFTVILGAALFATGVEHSAPLDIFFVLIILFITFLLVVLKVK